jgi:hypothetical protein
MSEILANGGSLTYVVLGLGGLGLLLNLVFAGLGFTKRRLPLTLFMLVPILVAAVGAVATWSAAGAAIAALTEVEPTSIAENAMVNLWTSQTADWLSRWVAAGVLMVGCWCAAVGSGVAAGTERLWTLGAAVMSFLCTVIGTVAIVAFSVRNELGQESFMLAGLLLFGGLGVTFSATRRSIEDEQMFRVAASRFVAGISLVIGVIFAATASMLGSKMAFFGADGIAQDATLALADVIFNWETAATPVVTCAWIAIGAAFIVAWFGFVAELGEIVQRYTLLDVVATMMLFFVLGGVRMVEATNTDSLMSYGTHGPAPELFSQFGSELPSALLSYKKEAFEVVPHTGGFDDVIAFTTQSRSFEVPNPDLPGETKFEVEKWKEWRRTHVRTADGWQADGTKLEDIAAVDGLPLIVIPSGAEGVELLNTMRKVTGKRALLLMSAAEVKADVEIPDQLAHEQITFMPIEIDHEMDLATETWTEAGARNMVMWGPIRWYDEKQDEEVMVYQQTLFEKTESPGMHVLVSDRTRTKSIVSSCLATQMELDEKGIFHAGTRWCSISDKPKLEMREAAAEVFELPEVETTRYTVKHETENMEKDADKAFREEIDTLFKRELGAVEWCQAEAGKIEGADEKELLGKMLFEITIRRLGTVNYVGLHEKSKMLNGTIFQCVRSRIKMMEFAELPEPEMVTDEEGVEKEGPMPKRSLELTVEFRK